MDWTDGYFADVEYTFGYYRELAPLTMDAALLLKSRTHGRNLWGQPAADSKPLRYLELGIGHGVSLAINAASNPGEFWGTDFHPGQVLFAQDLVGASGAQATVLDASFQELAARDDLPTFDVIALHGILSWISADNEKVILSIIKRSLAVGGLVYVSYNNLAGWASFVPIRQLMSEHALANSSAPALERVDRAIAFVNEVSNAGARMLLVDGPTKHRFSTLDKHDKRYLAHEYFNQEWRPMHFADLATGMSSAKLDYVASAHLLDNFDTINLNAEGRALLAQIPQPVLRETTRDVLMHQGFRRDIWSKGGRVLAPIEMQGRLARARVTLVAHPDHIKFEVKGALGTAHLAEDIYRPLIQAIGETDKGCPTIAALIANPLLSKLNAGQVYEAVMILMGGGYVAPIHDPTTTEIVAQKCKSLNAYIRSQALPKGQVNFLASPVIGGGVPVTRAFQLFLDARDKGARTTDALVQSVASAISPPTSTPTDAASKMKAEQLEQLQKAVVEFEKMEPIFHRLQVI